MKIKTAQSKDLERLYSFYDEVIAHQKLDEYSPEWTKDVYPSRNDLESFIENDSFYFVEEDQDIAAACVIRLHEDEIYLNANWSRKFEENEIAVLHLFAVHPSFRRKGYSDKLLKYMIEDNRNKVKTIHLDVLKGNLPAFRLYEKIGFTYIGEYEVYYPDTGTIVVDLLEYIY